MAASRVTHFVHADGTVSTNVAKTRSHTWAVEEEHVDGHLRAYAIVHWAERKGDAEKALPSFCRPDASYRVVKVTRGTATEPEPDTVPKLTPAQKGALRDARNLEAQGSFLMDSIGVALSTVRALARHGLVALEESYETPWRGGMRKPPKARRVWSAKLTNDGRVTAAHLRT